MKKVKHLIFVAVILLFWFSCEKDSYNPDKAFAARVVGYNMNCGTCILEFLYNSPQVADLAGEEESKRYEAINLNKGDYAIGEVIKCAIRETKTDEIHACIALYPDNNYKTIYVKGVERSDKLNRKDTINLGFHKCYSDIDNRFYICLDSVINDSRCPTGVECFWAGMVTVRFKFQATSGSPVLFNLDSIHKIADTTIMPGYRIQLLGVDPYPVWGYKIRQEDYSARIAIKKLK